MTTYKPVTTRPRRKRGCRFYLNLLIAFVLMFSFVYFVIIGGLSGIAFAYSTTHPDRNKPCCGTPADAGLAYSDVALTSDDGAGKTLTLRGWYLPSQNHAAIILLHGLGCNRMCLFDLGSVLNHDGYGVLLLDIRAHGNSDGEIYRAGWKDVQAAAAYLHNRPDVAHIGLWGFSLGGTAAILGAARSPEIDAVAVDGAATTSLDEYPAPSTLDDWLYLPYDVGFYLTWPLYANESIPSAVQSIAAISPRPVFIMAAQDETGARFEFNCAQLLYKSANQPKSLWIIPGIGHGGGFSTYPQEYEHRLVSFFNRALLTGTYF